MEISFGIKKLLSLHDQHQSNHLFSKIKKFSMQFLNTSGSEDEIGLKFILHYFLYGIIHCSTYSFSVFRAIYILHVIHNNYHV